MTCGIYRIYHKGTGKSYIGQSHNVEGRIRGHFKCLRNNTHVNIHLQRAFNLHGESSFEVQIVEVCRSSELAEKEQFWIDTALYYAGVYNLALIAGPGRKGVKASLETIQKQREALLGKKRSPEFCARVSEALRGRKISDEQKEALLKANFGRKHSEETRRKMSESAKRRCYEESLARNAATA
jgi:group I intron endonuclease